ncbi:Hint domain-containing protein [Asaia sp. HN010]|uniref:Hint domain-containing protein n=1 Tax=Asaia sp. HN010 TaxID=3081233 RepID=UPI003016D484
MSSGGQAQATVIGSGGSQVIYAGATAISSVVNAAGTIFTSSGGLDVGTTIVSGGSVVVSAGGTTTNMIVSSGGSATIASGGVIGGTLTLAGGGEATVDAQTTGTIDLGGSSHAKVTITGTGSPSIRMLGFNGDHAGLSDQIVLNDIRKSDIVSVSYPDADHVALHLRQGGVFVMFIPGVQQAGYALVAGDNGQTIFEVCYLAGTLIDTPQGRRPVETLRPGDPVYCYSDGTRHVEIIQFCGEGYKRVDTDLPLTLAGYPVEVAAHAFGPDAPCQNLLVTPEHCLFLDGKLVPSRLLVDGHAIKYRTDMTAYKYYHIETQKHRLIDCNGILSETYLDTGNRAIFTHHEALEGFTPQQRLWSRDAVAPLVTQADTVLQIRKMFPALQGRNGRSEDVLQTPYLQTASGRRIPPMRCDCNRVVFLLRERTDCFYLCSDTHIPSECYGCHLDDRRSLGVLAGEIDLYSPSGTKSLTRHLQRARLPGWHERDNGHWRWTAGSGLVTLEEADIEFPCIVSVQVAHAHYRAR